MIPCTRCGAERPPANLTRLPSGERWCPECLARRAEEQIAHPRLAGSPSPQDGPPALLQAPQGPDRGRGQAQGAGTALATRQAAQNRAKVGKAGPSRLGA